MEHDGGQDRVEGAIREGQSLDGRCCKVHVDAGLARLLSRASEHLGGRVNRADLAVCAHAAPRGDTARAAGATADSLRATRARSGLPQVAFLAALFRGSTARAVAIAGGARNRHMDRDSSERRVLPAHREAAAHLEVCPGAARQLETLEPGAIGCARTTSGRRPVRPARAIGVRASRTTGSRSRKRRRPASPYPHLTSLPNQPTLIAGA